MKHLVPDDPLLDGLQVADLARYLVRNSWIPIEHGNPRIQVYELPPENDSDAPIVVTLPGNVGYADARIRLAEAVNLLVEVQASRARDIVDSAKMANLDVFQIRLHETLSLNAAADRVSGIRNLLSNAACAEHDPRPYFLKSPAIGREFVERCRFGHTFRGSFGFTIESPVPLAPKSKGKQLSLIEESEAPPFERRVLQRIARGFILARKASKVGDLNVMIESSDGLNANMCEAILEIAGDSRNPIDCIFLWSSEWEAPKDIRMTSRIRLEVGNYNYVEATARHFRGSDLGSGDK